MLDGALALVFAGYSDKPKKEKNMITPHRTMNGYTREIECFAFNDCMNCISGYCQAKPDNIAPNDYQNCKSCIRIKKESK